jgi:hypothetical protein
MKMAQTRLQKLELLRKALVAATEQLFPELDSNQIEVQIYLHRAYSLSTELSNEDFHLKDSGEGTFWYENVAPNGNITTFYHKSDVI